MGVSTHYDGSHQRAQRDGLRHPFNNVADYTSGQSLRRELGYQNLIIADAMEMGAITQQYTNGEAAVGCIKAGVDIVLGPQVFTEAFDAVIKAVEVGEVTEQRIDESVRRILKPEAEHQEIGNPQTDYLLW